MAPRPRRVLARIDYVEHRGSDGTCMGDHQPDGHTMKGWAVVLPVGLLISDDDVGGWMLYPWHAVTWMDVDYVPVNEYGEPLPRNGSTP
jgi:hypothetical protein